MRVAVWLCLFIVQTNLADLLTDKVEQTREEKIAIARVNNATSNSKLTFDMGENIGYSPLNNIQEKKTWN